MTLTPKNNFKFEERTGVKQRSLKKIGGGAVIASGGTCQAQVGEKTEFGYDVKTGLTAKEAKDPAAASGGHWGCDNCSKSSWAIIQ